MIPLETRPRNTCCCSRDRLNLHLFLTRCWIANTTINIHIEHLIRNNVSRRRYSKSTGRIETIMTKRPTSRCGNCSTCCSVHFAGWIEDVQRLLRGVVGYARDLICRADLSARPSALTVNTVSDYGVVGVNAGERFHVRHTVGEITLVDVVVDMCAVDERVRGQLPHVCLTAQRIV